MSDESEKLIPQSGQLPAALGSPPAPGRFTVERLSSAFARLMGATSRGTASRRPQIAVAPDGAEATDAAEESPLAVTPRMIVEGLLFVGSADGRPLSARELAAPIRDVSPQEVEAIVAELNELYRREEAAYEVAEEGGGYRLRLRGDLNHVGERLRGRAKAAKLAPAAIEVLSVVAYRQPVTTEEINRLRGSRSQAILAQLVRRQLLRVDRPASGATAAKYSTTDRFNTLFGIGSPGDLPRSEDLDDS